MTGAIVHAFTTGTVVQVFRLDGEITAADLSGSDPAHHS